MIKTHCVLIAQVSNEMDPQTSLVKAIKSGDAVAVEDSLKHGVNPDKTVMMGYSLSGLLTTGSMIYYAIVYNSPPCLKILLKYGADPNLECSATYVRVANENLKRAFTTPLNDAIFYQQYENVKLLVSAGASLEGEKPYTPLIKAVLKGHCHIARLLLRCGAPVHNQFTNINFLEVDIATSPWFGEWTDMVIQDLREKYLATLGWTPEKHHMYTFTRVDTITFPRALHQTRERPFSRKADALMMVSLWHEDKSVFANTNTDDNVEYQLAEYVPLEFYFDLLSHLTMHFGLCYSWPEN